MRSTHRLTGLGLALAATSLAAVSLTACTTSVTGQATLVSTAQEASPEASSRPSPEPSSEPTPDATPTATPDATPEPDPEGPAEQPAGEPTGEPTGSVPAGTGDDLPVPGAGVPGDAGLCQAVAGWFGYAALALVSVDETGYVDPAVVVPLLEAVRDAPADHQDAGATLLAAAADVSAATDTAIDQVQSGTDVFVAFEGLTGPVTEFGDACTAAGVSV